LALVVIFMPGMGIRQCRAGDRWLITVDHKHVASERHFGEAMRLAKTFACATFRYLTPALLSVRAI